MRPAITVADAAMRQGLPVRAIEQAVKNSYLAVERCPDTGERVIPRSAYDSYGHWDVERLRAGWVEQMMSMSGGCYAATFAFHDLDLAPETASKAVGHWTRAMDHALLGRRWRNKPIEMRTRVIAVPETNGGAIHYHGVSAPGRGAAADLWGSTATAVANEMKMAGGRMDLHLALIASRDEQEQWAWYCIGSTYDPDLLGSAVALPQVQ